MVLNYDYFFDPKSANLVFEAYEGYNIENRFIFSNITVPLFKH